MHSWLNTMVLDCWIIMHWLTVMTDYQWCMAVLGTRWTRPLAITLASLEFRPRTSNSIHNKTMDVPTHPHPVRAVEKKSSLWLWHRNAFCHAEMYGLWLFIHVLISDKLSQKLRPQMTNNNNNDNKNINDINNNEKCLPQKTVGWITYPCLRYLLLTPKSSYILEN